jgi:hypothetical protein
MRSVSVPHCRRSRRATQAALLATLALLAIGCEAMIPYNWHSGEKDGERFSMSAVPADPGVPAQQVVLPRDGIAPSLHVNPEIFQLRISDSVARTVAVSPRGPSLWGARTTGEFFAEPPRMVDTSVRGTHGALFEMRPGVRGFRLERWLDQELATVLEFSLEPHPDACRVILDRIAVTDCRAKVADTSWRNFWTRVPLIYGFWFDGQAMVGMGYGDNAVDMRVDLIFTTIWTEASGETHTAPLAVMGWTVPDVPIGKPLDLHQSAGWLPFVPPSASLGAAGGTSYGRGLFTVECLVTEQDDLSPVYIADRATLGAYFDDLLGIVPGPGAP